MKLILIIVFMLSTATHSFSQVVNAERLRINDNKQGWSGSASGNLDIRRNQRSVFALGTRAHVQNRVDSNTYLLVGQAGFVKASGQDLVNFAFGHFRYTHYVTNFLSLEAFTQLQQNRVNGIASRWLVGCGVRGRVADSEAFKAHIGFMVMREREREVVDSIDIHRDMRISSYFAFSYTPEDADWITLASTTYFQPRIGKFEDIRIATDWNLQVKIRENLSLTTTFNLFYDARPPIGLRKTNYALLNGLKFKFG